MEYLIHRFILVYFTLLSIYTIVGMTISITNKRMPVGKKIQPEAAVPDKALVKRNIKQSIKSLASIAFLFAAGDWLQRIGIGFAPAKLTVWNCIWISVVSLFLFDTWFYWMHRLAHRQFFYVHVHQLHHLDVSPFVWNNNNGTMLENLLIQGYWMVVQFFIPVIPSVKLGLKIFDQIFAMIGHSGYEYAKIFAKFPSPILAVTHHDQHHHYFHYNFSTYFSLWDRWMQTLHPEYDSRFQKRLDI